MSTDALDGSGAPFVDATPGPNEDPNMSVQAWIEFYKVNPFAFGAADVLCLGPPNLARLTNFISTLLLYCVGDAENCVRSIRVILPPQESLAVSFEVLTVGLLRSLEQATGQVIARDAIAQDLELVSIHTVPELAVEAVLDLLRTAGQKSVNIILHASLYRTEAVTKAPVAETDQMKPWPPHLHTLGRFAVEIAGKTESYTLMDAGDFAPRDPKQVALLHSIDDCGLRLAVQESRAEMERRLQRWESLRTTGAFRRLLDEIDAHPIFPSEKASIKAQLLARSGHFQQAAIYLAEKVQALCDSAGPATKILLAEIAQQGQDETTARALLAASLDELTDEGLMNRALSLASRQGDINAVHRIDERIVTFCPDSPLALRRTFTRLSARGDLPALREYLATFAINASNRDLLEFYRSMFASYSLGESALSFVLAQLKRDFPQFSEEASFRCAEEAERRGLDSEVVMLASPIAMEGLFSRRACSLLLRVLERYLHGREASPEGEGVPNLGQALRAILVYLSNHPDDIPQRLRFADSILSVELAGMAGIGLLSATMLEMAKDLARPPTCERPAATSISDEQFKHEVGRLFEWMGKHAIILPGMGNLPETLVPEPALADALVENIGRSLEVITMQPLDRGASIAIQALLHFGLLWARVSNAPERGLVLLRIAGGGLANRGEAQQARDWAEHALVLAVNKGAAHKRQAWMTYADIYHRTRNVHEALMGIACALAQTDAQLSSEAAWHELSLLIRILRDLNLAAVAEQLLPFAEEAFRAFDASGSYHNQFLHLKHSVQMRGILRGVDEPGGGCDRTPEARLQQLLQEAAHSCDVALRCGDDPTPCYVLLGQLVEHATIRGLAIPVEVLRTLDAAIAEVPDAFAGRASVIALRNIDMGALHALLADADRARYSADLGFDIAPAVLVARKLLSSPVELDPVEVAFCIESLTDRALQLPGGRAIQSTEEMLRAVASFAGEGIAVHFIALDAQGRLVHVTLENGQFEPTVIEPETVFCMQKFATWGRDYPYQYASMDDEISVVSNKFLHSVDGVGLPVSPTKIAAVVADIRLQKIPPNIFRTAESFVGAEGPMIAVPSFSWMLSAQKAQTWNQGRVAWISTAGHADGRGALEILANRLSPSFARYHIELCETAEPPAKMDGAELVIVGAHGQLASDNQYFQLVADEASMRMSSRTLAERIGRARVVILFVCSAGRTDEHPVAFSTISLAHRLLGQGCLAVISSPWPLNVRVPVYWLPEFLLACQAGFSVAEANFLANLAVRRQAGDIPTYSLAMTVSGDPRIKLLVGD